MRKIAVTMMVLALSACGGGGDKSGQQSGTNEQSTPAALPGTPPANADKLKTLLADPCSIVPKEKVGEIAGSPVDKVDNNPSTKPTDMDAYCEYSLQEGGNVSIELTYASLNPSLYDSAEISSIRDVAEGTSKEGKKLETVNGVGDVAWYDPNREELTVFRGTAEKAVFHAQRHRGGDIKAITTGLAKAAGY